MTEQNDATPAGGASGVSEAEVEAGARAIALDEGHDPDEIAPPAKICGPNNEPLPIWRYYETQARAALLAASKVRESRGGDGALRDALSDAAEWHEHQLKALSAHPLNSSPSMRDAHREQAEALRYCASLRPSTSPADQAGEGWLLIVNAPKDGTRILYINGFDEVGHCKWFPALDETEVDCWWDIERDDEAFPRFWMRALPPAPPRDAAASAGEPR